MQRLSLGLATSRNFEHLIMLGATDDNNFPKRDGFIPNIQKKKK